MHPRPFARALLPLWLLLIAPGCHSPVITTQPPLRWPPTLWPCDRTDHPHIQAVCQPLTVGDLSAALTACDAFASDDPWRPQCAAFVSLSAAAGLDLGTTHVISTPSGDISSAPPNTSHRSTSSPDVATRDTTHLTQRRAHLLSALRSLTLARSLLPPPPQSPTSHLNLLLASLDIARALHTPNTPSTSSSLTPPPTDLNTQDALASLAAFIPLPSTADAALITTALLDVAASTLATTDDSPHPDLSLTLRALTLAAAASPSDPRPITAAVEVAALSGDCAALADAARLALTSEALPAAVHAWPSPLWAVLMLDANPSATLNLSLWPSRARPEVEAVSAALLKQLDPERVGWLSAAQAHRGQWSVVVLISIACAVEQRARP